MWDRIPGKNSMSGTIHFVMARCCAKQVNQQLIAHISHSGPVKAALKNVKSIWRRPKVSDASVLTLNTTAVSAHCPAASQHVANSSRTVKNNGHTPVPFPPASHLFSCKPDEMVVLAKKQNKKPHTDWITWKSQLILSSVSFLKGAPFHNDREQRTAGCENVLLGYFATWRADQLCVQHRLCRD